MFLPGDQPLLRRETVEVLVSHWEANPRCIVRPVHEATPGSPVVFPKETFEQLRNLPEGKGGGWIIKQHPEYVKSVPIPDLFELMDVDTPETLALLQERVKSGNGIPLKLE